jgi:carbon starvation protein
VSGTEELQGSGIAFNAGGAVAFASICYLLWSMILGLAERFLNPPLWLTTLIFVPGTFALSWLGTKYSTVFLLDHKTWGALILIYCAAASVVPVWALLQPRGYLGGFVLYAALAVGVMGVLFGGYPIQQPAFKSWDVGGLTGTMFPFLFVTIACGACSGFHGLVCSGTTSKQIDRETDMRAVGYGAMLAEGFVALIALVTVMIATNEALKGKAPGAVYGQGIGNFLTLLIGKENLPFAITFGAMAFSTFVFDTLDVCTRLGRYIVQELFGWRTRLGGFAGTLITMGIPATVVLLAQKGSWQDFWTLFGASNQLLAGLTLLSITVWLYQARQRIGFTLYPMLFVLTITLWALIKLVIGNIRLANGFDVKLVNALAAAALVSLALFLAATALVKLRGERNATLVPENA